ncbi:unnamed protein product [Alternaria alternata]
MRISGCGILLIGGEAYRWRPWLREGRKEGTVAGGGTGDDMMTGKLLNAKGQWEVQERAWGVLELLYPKPDLLIVGTGPNTIPLAPAVRKYLNDLGIRLEVQDTRNAAAQFNLLATERGVGQYTIISSQFFRNLTPWWLTAILDDNLHDSEHPYSKDAQPVWASWKTKIRLVSAEEATGRSSDPPLYNGTSG